MNPRKISEWMEVGGYELSQSDNHRHLRRTGFPLYVRTIPKAPSDVDALRQQELPRERVGEQARAGGQPVVAPTVSKRAPSASSHKQEKAPLCKGSWRQRRLRDCKSLAFTEAFTEKNKDSLCQVQPLSLVSLGTSPYTGQAQKCAAGCALILFKIPVKFNSDGRLQKWMSA